MYMYVCMYIYRVYIGYIHIYIYIYIYRIRFNSKLFNIVMISKRFLSTISSINHVFIEHKEINRKDEIINPYYLVYFRARRAFRKIIQHKKI